MCDHDPLIPNQQGDVVQRGEQNRATSLVLITSAIWLVANWQRLLVLNDRAINVATINDMAHKHFDRALAVLSGV
jgi:hypothetical protein